MDAGDVVDLLNSIEVEGKPLDDMAIASHLSMFIIGGAETFPKVFANLLRRLGENPDARARCAADPALIPDAFLTLDDLTLRNARGVVESTLTAANILLDTGAQLEVSTDGTHSIVNLTLNNDTLLIGMHKFQWILNSDNMTMVIFIDIVDHCRQGR